MYHIFFYVNQKPKIKSLTTTTTISPLLSLIVYGGCKPAKIKASANLRFIGGRPEGAGLSAAVATWMATVASFLASTLPWLSRLSAPNGLLELLPLPQPGSCYV